MIRFFSKIFIILFLALFLGAAKIEAAAILVNPSRSTLGLHEQFYIDLLLDPQDKSINGIEGSISFPPDRVSFIRSEDGKSIISLWIQSPLAKNNTIDFSGIITNGFSGVINPFDNKNKLPAIITRLVFEAISPGDFNIKISPIILTQNDGDGTVENIEAQNISFNVLSANNPITYKSEEGLNPELEAWVIQDPDLFENKYVLIFKATDKESGIKNVIIKEGDRKWEEVKSPYLLKDQTRHSLISLRAVNFSGVSVVVAIEPLPYENIWGTILFLIFIIVMCLVFVVKRFNENKKI